MTILRRPAPRRRLLVVAAAFLAAAMAIGPLADSPPASASTAVNGGGSGFAALEIQQWQADTARKPYNLSVNYSAQSSGVGRTNFASGLYDYGVSDIVYQPAAGEQSLLNQMQSGRCGGRPLSQCFRYVPVSSGGLSFMYNVVLGANRYAALQLTPTQVCGIFTQTQGYTKWSDLASDNPSLAGDSNAINVVTRSDSAGESYVLSQYCIATAPAIWQGFVNTEKGLQNVPSPPPPTLFQGQPISSWPAQLSQSNTDSVQQSGADGVANFVADPNQGQNSITYDAAGYALVRNFPTASVQNAAGVYTQPNETNVTVALAYANGNGDGTFTLNFAGADPRAYFPSTYSYALVQAAGEDPGKGATLGAFLCYDVGYGQTIAPQLRYARLSAAIVNIASQAIAAIPGAPSASACTAGAPPPPTAPTVVGGGGSVGSYNGGGATATSGTAAAAAAASGTNSSPAALAAAAAAQAATTTTVSKAQRAAQQAAQEASQSSQNASSTSHGSGGSTGSNAWFFVLVGALLCAIGVFMTNSRRAS